MYRAMAISVRTLKKEEGTGAVKITAIETQKPKELEKVVAKGESIEFKLMRLEGIKDGEVEAWTRIVTEKEVAGKNMHILKVRDEKGVCYGVLAEGPTRKTELTLWDKMSRLEKASWFEGHYLAYQGQGKKVSVIYDQEEMMRLVQELGETGMQMRTA